jgi:glycosyltransferase involved in cell wall biosynthesis
VRVLQVCHQYRARARVGGIAEHVRNISERLDKCDVTVATIALGELPSEEIINGVKVKSFRGWAPGNAYFFSRDLKKYLTENSSKFDVVHAHSYHDFPALYAASAKSSNKFVFTPHYHGRGNTLFRSMLHRLYIPFGKRILKKADRVVCVSRFEKNMIIRDFDLNREKFVVIPNGVNSEEFRELTKRRKKGPTILSVGRLEKYKGMQYLIRVLPTLDADAVLEIVGKGPYKENLVKLARKMGVNNRVQFSHDLPRNELLQRYADADVFVLLSRHEAYGMSVAEALCAKTLCIVANQSALVEWVDRENCYGIDYPINLHELKILVNTVLGKNIEGLKLPDWKEVTERLVDLYEDCLAFGS